MTKVCHMSSAHKSGDLRIFQKECVSLANAGYDVYFVAGGDSREEKGVHVIGIGEVTGGRLQRMSGVAKRVYEKARELDADIYHFHDPELLPYGLKLKKAGKKVIFDSHENTAEDIAEKTWIPGPLRLLIQAVFSRYQKYACSRLDRIVSVTPHICDYFRAFHPSVWMITNYPILQPPVEVAPRPRSLCFAGDINSTWCHEAAIQALETIDGCTYVLCGKGPEAYIKKLQELPGWEKVDFLGRIPQGEVHKTLSQCSIGLAVLQYTRNVGGKMGTLGNTKLFEEMMAQLPVICTDSIVWNDVVTRYSCGICVPPDDPDSLRTAIRYLLDHPEEAKQMGRNGRRAVEEEFNWSEEEKKLLALYEDILRA